MKIMKVNLLGMFFGAPTFASLLLPWWSIRASGVSIDVFPFAVRPWRVPAYDSDWVVGRLLALDGILLIVGLLVVASGILTFAGSLKLPPLQKSREVLGLVDTRSTFSVIPRTIFHELALKPTGRRVEVQTAKGSLKLEETYVQLWSEGVTVLTPFLVSDEVQTVLVGVITLEQLSLTVNPVTGKLERYPALLF